MLAALATAGFEPVSLETLHVNLNNYAGKWYVIASIPTRFDRNWRNITENYLRDKKGNICISTSYTRKGKAHLVRSKAFIQPDSGNSRWKVQYLWPFKAHYNIIELADDYSYTVVGHPRQKYLYIMSRTPRMNEFLLDAIISRCRRKGYDVDRLKMVQK